MTNAIIAFLVLLNPIEIFIFLQPVLRKMKLSDFAVVLARASVVALIIYILFALTGNFFFEHILQIDFESFRVFGGLIIAYLSFQMIVHGKKSFVTYSEDHSAVANEIAMPVMVGAGTISICILMGTNFSKLMSSVAILFVIAINFVVIMLLALLRSRALGRYARSFDKNMETVLRLIAFFGGAIGLDMIVTGVKGLMA